MPCFRLETNVKASEMAGDGNKKENFLKEMSKLVAEHLKKPESYVIVQLITDAEMCMGGEVGVACGAATLFRYDQFNVVTHLTSSSQSPTLSYSWSPTPRCAWAGRWVWPVGLPPYSGTIFCNITCC